jgi:hypothetical protein
MCVGAWAALLPAVRDAAADGGAPPALQVQGAPGDCRQERLHQGGQAAPPPEKGQAHKIVKYFVANATLFGYLFFNSNIGTVLRLMRNRFNIHVLLGVCLWFCRLNVGF